MIQIETIEIEEFRGIRKLMLSLNKQNFGICGPNGTGKSGIVDAIEFALTGDITRLSGLGSAELSVKAHAPHVDMRKHPEKCYVKITAFAPSLGHSITIERRVDAGGNPTIKPNDAKTIALVSQLAMHPEFALSRREIVKYILTPAGQRSKDVQALLRLDQIEKARQALQKLSNDTKKVAQFAASEDDRAKGEFLKHLGLAALTKAELLAAVNARRKVLQLPPITELKSGVSLKEGVVPAAGAAPAKGRIIKANALADIGELRNELQVADSAALSGNRKDALAILTQLSGDADALSNFKKQVLIEQGLELLDGDACPLCDKAWDMEELKTHLQQKLAKAAVAAEQLKKLEASLQPLTNNIQTFCRKTDGVVGACGLLEPAIDASALKLFSDNCLNDAKFLSGVCEDPSLIGETIKTLASNSWKPSEIVAKIITDIEAAVKALPEASEEDKAKDYLAVAQERFDRCGTTKRERESAQKRHELAEKVIGTYGATSNEVLEGVYDAVEKKFTEYYRVINSDDEEKFEGKLTPSPAKLAFDVDFYGRGKSPPGAYHSEGHQDGMGLCLYLALMQHTLGKDFTFAVLDDVLMSVDTGHRREVCTLLRTKFPKTQFVLTTHDQIWLQFMKTQNLIQSNISFGGWTVDTGPQVWKEGDVWKLIDEKLAKNDVPGAAGALRRYLEHVSRILADNFRAGVEFRADGHYDLGDLMPPVVQAWKRLMQLAREAAISWGQDTAAIDAFQKVANEKVANCMAEQWMINKAVHYNEWAALDKNEFAKVTQSFRELLESMECTKAECMSFLAVSPPKGKRESLRCDCGNITFNVAAKDK